jgi:DNA-binding MarR family transcriptional regulator
VLAFMQLLWAVDHGLRSISKRMQARLGVTGPQRLVLRMVGRFPGVRPGEVAELLHVHPSTLTGVLERLEQRGLIRRGEHSNDGRSATLHLTRAGQRVNSERSHTVEARVRRVLAGLPAARIAAASVVLEALALDLSQKGLAP